MKHYFEEIDGWFDYSDLYKAMVSEFNSGHFVEVGAWKGKSAAFMGVEIINSEKPIRFDTVDHFIGVEPVTGSLQQKQRFLENYKVCIDNLQRVKVNVIPLRSADAVKLYIDGSLDFVFIDANHAYPFVKQDILVWYPKVKNGGVFAGHDYTSHKGVKKAVDEIFPEAVRVSEKCWMFRKT